MTLWDSGTSNYKLDDTGLDLYLRKLLIVLAKVMFSTLQKPMSQISG